MSVPRPDGRTPVPLDRLAALAGVRPGGGWDRIGVSGVTLDSRSVRRGDLYAALPGAVTHGGAFVTAAIGAGAVAVLTEPGVVVPEQVPVLAVDRPRRFVGGLAAEVYGHPAAAMTMIGVTGTNGKTTVTYLLDAALRACGRVTGLIGTIETRLRDEVIASVRTTPEAPDLHALLAVARERGVQAVAMEVSSHALDQHRVDGITYDVGVFTGLSQDHLDYHGTMERYFAAKASLFEPGRCRRAVICVDDAWGRRLARQVRIPVVTYAVGDGDADWRAGEGTADARGSQVPVQGPHGADLLLGVPLPGSFNVANALAALAAGACAGLDVARAAAGVAAAGGPPGRLERVEAGQAFTALVDYAHTPDAVARVLAALRPLTRGRLVVVLGAGGDRDHGKRPAMARAAVAGSDLAVFTSDNPRSEDPMAILGEMTAGLSGRFVVEPDRAAAIALAAAGLESGDTLLVAGKGHETGQESAGVVRPFDDRDVLRRAIAS
ncbi:MAG TPA: UDP-N-acetylmuramoyl-L-alanyl-D-glutamate--2,6-diaminopimelate ligase [Mycobacteriales bacterium]